MKYRHWFLLSLLIICSFLVILSTAGGVKLRRPFNNSVPAAFIFGDSTVDSGNNNFIVTTTKSNYPPYGLDFENHIPTGRFTNGRLVTDFLVAYVGIKEMIPPYLDPTLGLEDLITGVCFASAGGGFDPVTAKISGVIPMEMQLQYFREYKARIEAAIGNEKAKSLISKAIFLISCGTNDFVVTYFSTPLRRKSFTVLAYQNFLLETFKNFTQVLIQEGAQRFAIVGLPPMGCLPVVINLNSKDAINDRRCIEKLSSVARVYNQALQNVLNSMQQEHPNLKVMYADIFDPLDDMIKNPQKYGFSDVNTACCGEGPFPCSPFSNVCPDTSKKIFWDQVHPTQAAYYNLYKAFRPAVNKFISDEY